MRWNLHFHYNLVGRQPTWELIATTTTITINSMVNHLFETCLWLEDSMGVSTLQCQTTLWLFEQTLK